jgi:DNA-binding XRE family transcriptional regulator
VKKAVPETKRRKPFDALREPIDADPVRRSRVDDYKHAMREAVVLAQLRESRAVTQEQLAVTLEVSQPNVSRIEHQDDLFLSTLRSYVEALGGQLELRAVFDDETLVFDASAPGATPTGLVRTGSSSRRGSRGGRPPSTR